METPIDEIAPHLYRLSTYLAKFRYLSLIIALTLLAMLGCSKLTMDNYAKIKTGMEYADVVKILGKPDRCSEALFARSCVWGNEQKNITVNFLGGKVVLSSSSNIR